MKRLFEGVVLGALATLLFVGCGSDANVDKKVASEKVLKVGATGQSYPVSYRVGDKLVGFDVEVLETIAKNLGYKVEWTTMDFGGAVGQLDAGKLDTIANEFTITEQRKAKYNFTDVYYYAGIQIVTHIDNTNIKTLEDFYGKTISAVTGSNKVKVTENFFAGKNVTVRTYETRDGAMGDVLNKRVDGYVNSRGALAVEIAKNKLPVKFVGDPISSQDIAFPFLKNEKGQALLKEFNQEIQKLKEDGTLKKISEKYFHEDETIKREAKLN